jgi:hypothetical protein
MAGKLYPQLQDGILKIKVNILFLVHLHHFFDPKILVEIERI